MITIGMLILKAAIIAATVAGPSQPATYTVVPGATLSHPAIVNPDRISCQRLRHAAGIIQAAISPASRWESFRLRVIAAESGGRAQVMNPSGHYGLYQFCRSTWIAFGGNPATFGCASPEEQTAVFWNAIRTPGGYLNWSPYDGVWP